MGDRAWLRRKPRGWSGPSRLSADVVAEEPTAEHLQGLGELLSRQGHFNQAETYLREAALKDPTRALIFSDLADTLMGRITGENLDDPVALTPEEQQQLAGEALAALGRPASWIAAYRDSIRAWERSTSCLHQPDDALIALEEAIRLDPADADAHYTLGAMLMDRKRYEDAVSHFVTAVQLAPLALQARLSLAAATAFSASVRRRYRELDAIDRIQPGLPQVAELRSRLAEQQKRRCKIGPGRSRATLREGPEAAPRPPAMTSREEMAFMQAKE